MKCVIPGPNVKVFGRAIHSLSKLGEELYIEPLENGLALRTVNSSRSAYACFIFAPSFFLHYEDSTAVPSSAGSEEEEFKCKIGMKSCLTVFKSLGTIERTVDKCKITLNMAESRLVFQLYCRHGIVKTHNLAFIECETLQAVFSKEMTPNVITAHSRLLCDVVQNFQTTQEEVTLIVNPEKVSFKNYVEDEPDPKKVIHTEMKLDPEEFENYQCGIDSEVTFCLKELRAILSFSETMNTPLSVNFEGPGKPIVFSLDTDPTYEANFVLATLADVSASQMSQQSTQRPMQSVSSRQTPSSSRITQNRPTSYSIRQSDTPSNRPKQNGYHNNINRTDSTPSPYPNQRTFTDMLDERGDRASSSNQKQQSKSRDIEPTRRTMQSTLRDSETTKTSAQSSSRDGETTNKAIASSSRDIQSTNRNVPSVSHDQDDWDDDSEMASPIIPAVTSRNKVNVSVAEEVDMDEGVEDDVPGTPPSKKFKSMFFGLSQSTTGGTQQDATPPTVLAADSDSD